MKFITKLGVACTTVAMMASTLSYAGTVSTGALLDRYVGASYGTYNDKDYLPDDTYANYDVSSMQVSKTDEGILTVKVSSKFIGFDSIFKLGDLFLMDGNTYNTADTCGGSMGANGYRGCNEDSYDNDTNKWEYAFDLGLDLANTSIKNSTSEYTKTDGVLREIDPNGSVTSSSSDYHDDVNSSSQLKGGGGVRGWQLVDVKGTTDEALDENGNYVGVDDHWQTSIDTNNNVNNFLTMSFDISGTSLMAADQIALRWAMSCANDIIEVVADLRTSSGGGGGSTPVPEPSTFMLMLLAGFGLFASKQKKDSKFKA
jgi:hypothetical protein